MTNKMSSLATRNPFDPLTEDEEDTSLRHEDQAKEPPQDPSTTDSDDITTSHNNKTPALEEPSSVDSDKASFHNQYLNHFTLPFSPNRQAQHNSQHAETLLAKSPLKKLCAVI